MNPLEFQLKQLVKLFKAANVSARKLPLLGEAARAALAVGANPKAQEYARALVDLAQRSPGGGDGNALHEGHTLMGLAALRLGNPALAQSELAASAQGPPTPQLASLGPSMELAAVLANRGERATVLAYLAACAQLWPKGVERLTEWSAAVRDGKIPEDWPGSESKPPKPAEPNQLDAPKP